MLDFATGLTIGVAAGALLMMLVYAIFSGPTRPPANLVEAQPRAANGRFVRRADG